MNQHSHTDVALQDPQRTAEFEIPRPLAEAHRIPRRVRDAICVLTLAATDVAATFAAVGLAWFVKDSLSSRLHLKTMSFLDLVASGQIMAVAVVAGFLATGLYLRREPFWESVRLSFRTLFCSLTVSLALLYLSHIANEIPRSLATLSGICILILVPPCRLLTMFGLSRGRLWCRHVAVIGVPSRTRELARDLESDFSLGYRVEGLYLPTFGALPKLVDEIVLVAADLPPPTVDTLVARLHREAGTVTLVPDFGLVPLGTGMTRFLLERRQILLTSRNLLKDPANVLVKRLFDLFLSLFLCVIALPVLVVIAIVISIDSPGFPVFSQTRIGRNGRRFRCLKFRTMFRDAEARLASLIASDATQRAEWERHQKLKHDPRVTRIGRFLRRTSLDELPQILNVIHGSMSLVGPRPLPQYHYERIPEPYSSDYLQVLPGITGLWQVSGRADNDVNTMATLNSVYARNWSLWLDVTLILRTLPAVVSSRGAY